MSTRNRAAVLGLALGFMLCATARGDGISGAVTPQTGGGINQFDGGIGLFGAVAKPVAGCGLVSANNPTPNSLTFNGYVTVTGQNHGCNGIYVPALIR